jgi:hypothetical protein
MGGHSDLVLMQTSVRRKLKFWLFSKLITENEISDTMFCVFVAEINNYK